MIANRTAVVAAIDAVLDAIDLSTPSTSEGEYEARERELRELVGPLVEQLRVVPEIRRDFDGTVQYCGDACCSASLRGLASWMVRRATAVGSEKTVDELASYLAATHTERHDILGLRGVTVSKSTPLGAQLTIQPFSELPDGRCRAAHHRSDPRPDGASAALVLSVKAKKVHLEGDGRYPAGSGSGSHPDLRDARYILGLLEAPSQEVVAWTQPAPHIPRGYPDNSSTTTKNDGKLEMTALSEEHVADFPSVFQQFKSLNGADRRRLRIPLYRLIRSRATTNSLNRAIEVGIGFESLFLPDMDHEVTYRLRQRVARLLGDSPSERRALSDEMKDIYRLRSNAVHSGRIGGPAARTKELIARGEELLRASLRRFIEAPIAKDQWTAFDLGDLPEDRR